MKLWYDPNRGSHFHLTLQCPILQSIPEDADYISVEVDLDELASRVICTSISEDVSLEGAPVRYYWCPACAIRKFTSVLQETFERLEKDV